MPRLASAFDLHHQEAVMEVVQRLAREGVPDRASSITTSRHGRSMRSRQRRAALLSGIFATAFRIQSPERFHLWRSDPRSDEC